jgi:hypothetical protein
MPLGVHRDNFVFIFTSSLGYISVKGAVVNIMILSVKFAVAIST